MIDVKDADWTRYALNATALIVSAGTGVGVIAFALGSSVDANVGDAGMLLGVGVWIVSWVTATFVAIWTAYLAGQYSFSRIHTSAAAGVSAAASVVIVPELCRLIGSTTPALHGAFAALPANLNVAVIAVAPIVALSVALSLIISEARAHRTGA